MTKTTPPPETPKINELIPERIAELLGEPPVLSFENAERFEALHAELVVDLDPKDMIERIWVRDLAEIRWEIMRLRDMRRAAIENSLPAAAAQLVPKQLFEAWGEDSDSSASLAERIARDILHKASRGDEDHRKCLSSIISVGGVTTHMLKVVAYTKDMRTISALDDAISLEARRFDQIVHILENRMQKKSGHHDEQIDPSPAEAVKQLQTRPNLAQTNQDVALLRRSLG